MGIPILCTIVSLFVFVIDLLLMYKEHKRRIKRNDEWYIDYYGKKFRYRITDSILSWIYIPLFTSFIIITIILVMFKNLDEKDFALRYELIKTTITSSDDVRDATYTDKVLEINEEILKNRYRSKSKWRGIYYSKKIGTYELITYESD